MLPLARVPAEAPEPATYRWQTFCADGRARRLAARVIDDRLDAAAIAAFGEPYLR